MRALIVDDDAELRDLIAQRLREVGHVVSVSASGVDGTQGVMNGDFDVQVGDRDKGGAVPSERNASRSRIGTKRPAAAPCRLTGTEYVITGSVKPRR